MAVAALAIALVSTSADLGACGDKYLRVGRSARLKGYAAIHPASILVYRPLNSTAKGVKEFEALLKRAGHNPIFVQNGTALAQLVAGARYDLVIADYADAAAITQQLRSVAARPDVLPMLDNPSKELAARARMEYQHLLTPHNMTRYDALDEIDHVMDLRLKGTPAASAIK